MLLANHESIFAYIREDDQTQLLVICNFYDQTVDCPYKMPGEDMRLLISNYKDTDQNFILRPYEARMYLGEK